MHLLCQHRRPGHGGAINQLEHVMGLRTIGEGVENETLRSALAGIGVGTIARGLDWLSPLLSEPEEIIS